MLEEDQSCAYAAQWRKLLGKSTHEDPDCGSHGMQTGLLFRSVKKSFLDAYESLASFTTDEVDYQKCLDNERRMMMLASRLDHFIESEAMRTHVNRVPYTFILETIANHVNDYFTRVNPEKISQYLIGMTMSTIFSKLSLRLQDNRDKWSTLHKDERDFIERFIAIGEGEAWELPGPNASTMDHSNEEARRKALHWMMDEVASLHSRVDTLARAASLQ
jgi:hypothetical protein